jgi:hypothetical protein
VGYKCTTGFGGTKVIVETGTIKNVCHGVKTVLDEVKKYSDTVLIGYGRRGMFY